MQTVITSEQAKSITGGRTPNIPVEYETAIRALTECMSIDDAKRWSDKADALAAWAKIYHSDEATRKAKMLKLEAFRRMGQLAEELRPKKHAPSGGPARLLREHGLSSANATSARILASMPEQKFGQLVSSPSPPAPATVRHLRGDEVSRWHEGHRISSGLRSFCRRNTPDEVIRGMSASERSSAIDLVTELTEWLDAFQGILKRRATR